MPPVYRGPFGKPQAERFLWRAGFGPRRGEAERLAKLGLEGPARMVRLRSACGPASTASGARSRTTERSA